MKINESNVDVANTWIKLIKMFNRPSTKSFELGLKQKAGILTINKILNSASPSE